MATAVFFIWISPVPAARDTLHPDSAFTSSRKVKPALAISAQWPSKVVTPRYPSSILAKPPVLPCLDQVFWKWFVFNCYPSSFWGRKTWPVHTLRRCWKAVDIYTLPCASGKYDTLLLVTKDLFVCKVNAAAESYKLPGRTGAGWSRGTARCCATRAGDHMPVWTSAGLSHSSGRKCLTCCNAGERCGSAGLSAARGKGCTGSCSMQQKIPSIHTRVCSNSPKHHNPVCGHTLACRRTFSCEQDVLEESLLEELQMY